MKSYLSAPFRYFSHRLIEKVVAVTGDYKDSSDGIPSIEVVARADNFDSTKVLPKDQLHLDPQVIR